MDVKDQRILVTGAAGLVGSHLVARLLALGARVRATVHRKTELARDPGAEYLQADLTRADDCRRVVAGQRCVCMCAGASFGAAQIAANPMALVTPNVLMNTRMLEAAYEEGVEKFVWLSSTTGYPPSDSHPLTEDELFRGEPFEKYYQVGWMIRFTEVLCRMYGEKLARPMTTIVLRPTNIYGPGDRFDPQHSHVTAALIRKVVERQDPIEVWGTGDDVRDLLFVEDMVEAIVAGLRHIDSFLTLNIGLGKGYSVKEVLRLILDLDGYQGARVVFNQAGPTMIPVRLVDTGKAEKLLGFRAKTDLREGLRRTIAWYREAGQPALA